MERIEPRVDIAFKKIFGVEENKDLLVSLINSIVKPEDHIQEATLLNPYNAKNFQNDKLSILEIKAIGEGGKRFDIEIRIRDESDYDKQTIHSWARLYTEQLKARDDYSQLSKAIVIHVLNFISIFEVNEYHNVFQIRKETKSLLYFKDIELHTLELKKFTNQVQGDGLGFLDKVRTSLDAWMFFLTRPDRLNSEELPLTWMNREAVKKALHRMAVMPFKDEERNEYEDRLKGLRVIANTLKKYYAKGFDEGKAEGKKEIALKLL